MKLINFKNLLLLPVLALPILLFSQESDQEEVNPYEVLLDAINKNADVEKQFDIKRFNTIEAKVIELRNIKSVSAADHCFHPFLCKRSVAHNHFLH